MGDEIADWELMARVTARLKPCPASLPALRILIFNLRKRPTEAFLSDDDTRASVEVRAHNQHGLYRRFTTAQTTALSEPTRTIQTR